MTQPREDVGAINKPSFHSSTHTHHLRFFFSFSFFLVKKEKTSPTSLKMKAAFVLAALATLVVAAPQLEENIPYAPVIEVGEADVSAQLTSVDAVSLHSSK